MTRHDLAINYNDISILENMHASKGWRLCTDPKHNIFSFLSPDELKLMRELIITMVIDTDMARHSTLTAKFAAKVPMGIDWTNSDDKKMILTMLLHCSDLGNTARGFEIASKWGHRVTDEFFNQGDKEKELGYPITPNMDRRESDVAKCQMTFLKFVISPLFKEWCDFIRTFGNSFECPSSSKIADQLQTNVNNNIFMWLTLRKDVPVEQAKAIPVETPRSKSFSAKLPRRRNFEGGSRVNEN
eukprot:c21354_g1_i2.p1 GENE.c21354_g1_i2~~c21354_g1_i2.p1  ORF type:complete len:243 (-),score=90.19 c21354_g1_i2:14-742(-)